MEWLEGLDAHWLWLTLGVLLAALEMVIPGTYLLWLGLAAIATGVLTWAFDLSLPMQIIDFVSLSLIAAFSARRFLAEKPIASADPLMNRRGARLMGERVEVTRAIEHGSGRVKHGDSEWLARGPDMAVGERARIVGVEGATLLIEPVGVIEQERDGTPPSTPS